MEKICVEILLATYNGEKYIKEQIDSILQQTARCWHVTFSDDCSTDNTVRILDKYVQRHPNKMTRVSAGKKFGNARDHFFWLLGQCKADYIMFCDQDDRWKPEKIQRTLEEIIRIEGDDRRNIPILVFTDQIPTDAMLHPIAQSLMRYQNQFFEYFDYRSLLMQNVVTGGAMCVNRALADLALECKDSSRTIMHDWWLAIVAAKFGTITYIDEPLSDYRQHSSNSVGAKNVRSLAHVVKKLFHLHNIRNTLIEKKAQAQVFMQTYCSSLSKDDTHFLQQLIKQRSGPLFYWKNRHLIHGFFRLVGMMTLG